MNKKIKDENELIIVDNMFVDVKELKKIIHKWQSGEFYNFHYNQGLRGEKLYELILATIDYHADVIESKIIEKAQKKFGSNVCLNWSYPKSDIRSIGFEVLDLLDGDWWIVERLITDDIPAILEFLNTPPDKSLEAWDKWEKYWANLDYPERRKKLLKMG
jgi:hypothetical protein